MNRYTGVLCLLLLLLWPASSAAQQGRVGGSVVDQTGLALPGATVTVRGAGGPRTVASDERGDFELDGIAPGPYTLTVSLPGFSDATVDGVVVPAGGLALPPVVLQLARFGDAVVVTASRNEVRLIDALVSTSVISATTLETTPALNYGGLLRAVPGPNPYLPAELNLPPAHRFNAQVTWNGSRLLGSASVNAATAAFWSDVLTAAYHGYTDGYATVNGSVGVKWQGGAVTTTVKVTNLFNQTVQQHIFGDLLRRLAPREAPAPARRRHTS